MTSAAQILANQANAQRSTGPVTAEGKARVSQNAIKLGLFSASAFVRPDEREVFNQFNASYMAELSPETPLEHTLAREIVHAAWRLRRCAEIECVPPENATPEELDRLQSSIDRARTTAQRSLHRSLAELRRLQTERVYRQLALPRDIDPERPHTTGAIPDSAKQSQSATSSSVPRNAACPCGSREKYKRCCGKNAPTVLSPAAYNPNRPHPPTSF